MSAPRLAELIALAREPSSERRRALLRELTDVFLDPAEPTTAEASLLFDEVAGRLQADMDEAVRAAFAERVAQSERTPYALASRLAHDDAITVAGPVLRQSPVLDEAALLSVARTKGQDHLRAVGSRPALPASVTEVVVERGDDETVLTLLQNGTALFNRAASEAVVERAETSPALQPAVIDRPDLPADLLNELYFAVETRLRWRIMQRNADLSPEQLDAALAAGRERLARRAAANQGADEDAGMTAARALLARGEVTPSALAGLLRRGERATVVALLALRVNVPFVAVRRVFEHADLDALGVLCRVAGFDKALFLTFAVTVLERTPEPMAAAREYARLYDQLTPEAADRVIRFWRLRRTETLAA